MVGFGYWKHGKMYCPVCQRVEEIVWERRDNEINFYCGFCREWLDSIWFKDEEEFEKFIWPALQWIRRLK